jgi:hypothetical protein
VQSIGTVERPRYVSAPDGWGCFVAALEQRLVPADTVEGVAAAQNLGQTSTGEPVLSSTVMLPPRLAALDEELRGLAGEDATLFLEDKEEESRSSGAASLPLILADLQSSVDATSHAVLHALHRADAAAVAAIVDAINTAGGLWQARVPEELLGASLHELRAKLGASTTGKSHVPSHSRGAAAARRIHAASSSGSSRTDGSGGVRQQQQQQPPSPPLIREASLAPAVGLHTPIVVDVSGYPTQLDWSTRDGGKYVTKIIDQRSCGSCYAISAADALTSRARIRSAALADAGFTLAPESIVRCSVYNQARGAGWWRAVAALLYGEGVGRRSRVLRQ